jgi:ankyrin repeat protein
MKRHHMQGALLPPPTPLLAALWDGDRAGALRLLAEGADPNIPDPRPIIGDAATALHLAALADDPELIRALLAAGARVDAHTGVGQTPLWLACNGGHLAAAQALLAAGADPNARSAEGYSPLGRVPGNQQALMALLQSHGGVV